MKNARISQDFELFVLLTQVGNAALKLRERELRQSHLSVAQAGILRLVRAIQDKATPAEISRWTMREDHSVSGILDRMEKEGLVKRVADPNRKKGVRVALMGKGEQAYLEASKLRGTMTSIFTGLSDEERKQLRSALIKVREEALKELKVKYRPPLPSAAAGVSE